MTKYRVFLEQDQEIPFYATQNKIEDTLIKKLAFVFDKTLNYNEYRVKMEYNDIDLVITDSKYEKVHFAL